MDLGEGGVLIRIPQGQRLDVVPVW